MSGGAPRATFAIECGWSLREWARTPGLRLDVEGRLCLIERTDDPDGDATYWPVGSIDSADSLVPDDLVAQLVALRDAWHESGPRSAWVAELRAGYRAMQGF